MKFLKADGTIEDGTPMTDQQAEDMKRIEEMMHIVVCKNGYHYDWQGAAPCRKVANNVAMGGSLLEALEELKPKPRPEPAPEPEPVPEPEMPPTQPVAVPTALDDILF